MLEWFDWTLYGILSPYLAATFFSQDNPQSALLSTLAVFAGGFVARPVGGFLFGRFGDRVGRRITLLVTMLTLSFSTLAMALIPGYDEIGVWASLLLLTLRILQGLAHGGEAGISYTYVAEIAPPQRRGLWTSAVYVSVMIGVMGATATAAILASLLGKAAMGDWGWRFGFGVGAVLAVYVLILRRFAQESRVFEEQKAVAAVREHDGGSSVDRGTLLRACAAMFLLSAATNVVYYTWVTFAPVNAINIQGMSPGGAYIASLLAQLLGLFAIVGFGRLSDRVGRRPMLFAFGVAVIALVVPIQKMLTDQPWTLFVAQSLGLTAWALIVGMYPALMAELAPTAARARTVGVMTSAAAAVFGGTAPYLYTWFASTGRSWAFIAYIMVLAVITVIVTFSIKETKGVDLNAGLHQKEQDPTEPAATSIP
ncbi:MFS transporter [Mycolicibacterium goodii]|nr:MFS transporter [Mycolicibacterium goodii]MBU8834502.1 MFS transporter [Mycolicibacterium goodii]